MYIWNKLSNKKIASTVALFCAVLIFACDASKASVTMETAKTTFENSCAECHGQKVFNFGWPALYGMKEKYFIKQVKDFRSKTRIDHKLPYGGMNSYVEDWSDELITAVAKYVSTRSLCEISRNVIVNPRGGDVKAGAKVAAANSCLECHNNSGNVPLGSQLTRYMDKQLVLYKAGDRRNGIMQGVAEGMSEEDMLNVSAYLNALRSCKGH